MEYKIFESSDTNVKKFVFEWGASAVTIKELQKQSFIVMENTRREQ